MAVGVVVLTASAVLNVLRCCPDLASMDVSAYLAPRDTHPENRPWGGMRMLYVHKDAA